jgi:hypothetical protein
MALSKRKSIKGILFFIVIGLCLVGFFRFLSSGRRAFTELGIQSASPRQIPDKTRVDSPQPNAEGGGSNNPTGNINDWSFSKRAVAALESAQLEVCVIDAQSSEAIRVGLMNISREPAETILSSGDLDQNGCVGFALSPGRYRLHYQIPGYYGGRGSEALEIESASDRVKKTVEFCKTATVRGIVKNAFNRPESDAFVLCGKPVSSSSFAPMAGPTRTNESGEFSTDWPSNQKGIMVYASKPPYPITQIGPFDANEIGNVSRLSKGHQNQRNIGEPFLRRI